MTDEFRILRTYIQAVGRYWWAIIAGLVLTLLDGVERIFGSWYRPPLWAKVATATIGLAVAQYCAYRDLARSVPDMGSEFKNELREVFRNADLRWNQIDRPEASVTGQEICKQVDKFRAALEAAYGRCPETVDSQPLRDAIDALSATRAHRFGDQIGSNREAELVMEKMRAALAGVRAMLENL